MWPNQEGLDIVPLLCLQAPKTIPCMESGQELVEYGKTANGYAWRPEPALAFAVGLMPKVSAGSSFRAWTPKVCRICSIGFTGLCTGPESQTCFGYKALLIGMEL